MVTRVAKYATKFTVVRDQQEKVGYWHFPPSDACAGTVVRHLKTADYTLEGWEQTFVVERKRNSGEFASNLFQSRFERELKRLDSFPHAYLVLDFLWEDIITFPANSGIPEKKWSALQMTPKLFALKFHEMRLAHPNLRVEFVGGFGREYCYSLFKRIAQHVPPDARV